MKKIKKIWIYGMPDQDYKPDGYNIDPVPAISKGNQLAIIDKINEIIDIINDEKEG